MTNVKCWRPYLLLALGTALALAACAGEPETSQYEAAVVPTSGRVGEWKLNEGTGTTTSDTSGNNNTGMLSGGATWGTGKVGAFAGMFDGVDDRISVGHGATLTNLATLSMAAWIKPVGWGGGGLGRIASTEGLSDNVGRWMVFVASDGSVTFVKDHATTELRRATNAGAVTLNTWTHVAVTWDGTATAANTHIFVNGVEAAYAFNQSGQGTKTSDTGKDLLIGNNATLARGFQGSIDEVRVYNRALNSAEVGQIYSDTGGSGLVGEWKLDETSGTTASDTSGAGNHGTVLGGAAWTTGRVNGALNLVNGTSGTGGKYVTIPNSATLENVQEGDYTVATWFNAASVPPNTTTNNQHYALVSKQGSHTGLFYKYDQWIILGHYLTGGGWTGAWAGPYAPGTWHHAVGVISKTSGTAKLYVDGALKMTGTFTPGTAANEYGTTSWAIGRSGTGGFGWDWALDGKIDQVRIYNRAISDTEVGQLYGETGSAPDTTAPAAVTLSLSTPTSSSINVSWTAPGDDGTTGTATSYDLRRSTSAITTANWASATQVTGEPLPAAAGTAQNMTVPGLSASTTYFFAIKTSDEVPNTSAISNSPSLATSASGGGAAVTVDCNTAQGTIPRYERFNNPYGWVASPLTNALLTALGTSIVRAFEKEKKWSPSENVYTFTNGDAGDKIVALGAAPTFQFGSVPQWLADIPTGGVWNENLRPADYNKYETMMTAGLTYYKGRYPQAVYVEPHNEPDAFWSPLTPLSVNDYFNMYKRTVNAVNAVNATLAAGIPKLKVGGPTVSAFDAAYIQSFLDLVKNNNVKLDFVAWHDYHHPSNPSFLKSEVQQVDGWLASRGMVAETIVSEWNLTPGADNPADPSATELARTATFVCVGDYYWLEGGLDKSMHWAMVHENNHVLSELGPVDGSVYPYYNVLKMRSMLKTTRVSASSDSLLSTGLGVGSLATSDSTGVAVLVWNYQYTGTTSKSATVNINNLPSLFAGKSIRYERYLVDATHSNYAYNTAQDKLEKVENLVLSPRTSHAATMSLAPNSVSLVVLTPI